MALVPINPDTHLAASLLMNNPDCVKVLSLQGHVQDGWVPGTGQARTIPLDTFPLCLPRCPQIKSSVPAGHIQESSLVQEHMCVFINSF